MFFSYEARGKGWKNEGFFGNREECGRIGEEEDARSLGERNALICLRKGLELLRTSKGRNVACGIRQNGSKRQGKEEKKRKEDFTVTLLMGFERGRRKEGACLQWNLEEPTFGCKTRGGGGNRTRRGSLLARDFAATD